MSRTLKFGFFTLIFILLVTACKPKADMPNPASKYCEENGGTVDIRTLIDGSQTGFCVFPDGSECDEWAFYRGECKPGDSLINANMPNPASVFCEENGGVLEIRTDEIGGQVGICVFDDTSECDEWAFFRGECKPGESLMPIANMPNPASVYCEEHGGTLRIDTDAQGAQVGMCVFSDGSACEEWAFSRGECVVGGIYPVEVYAEDGCKVYSNETLGYSFHFPKDTVITSASDPKKTLTIQGPLVDGDYFPMIYINHPFDRTEFSIPAGWEMEEWLVENNLLSGEWDKDVLIAGEPAIHQRHPRSEQSYASDHYFFAKNGGIYNIVILHTGDKEDWTLYNHFLESITFN